MPAASADAVAVSCPSPVDVDRLDAGTQRVGPPPRPPRARTAPAAELSIAARTVLMASAPSPAHAAGIRRYPAPSRRCRPADDQGGRPVDGEMEAGALLAEVHRRPPEPHPELERRTTAGAAPGRRAGCRIGPAGRRSRRPWPATGRPWWRGGGRPSSTR